MADPVLTLEYEMTVDDMRAEWARARKRSVQDRFRWGAAAFMAWMAWRTWGYGDYWLACFLMLSAVYFAFERDLLFWLMFRWMERRFGGSKISIEVENNGLLCRNATQKYGERFWWSRLTKCEERDGGFDLFFDGDSHPRLHIPIRVFVDDEQRATFRALVEHHLPQPTVSSTR